MSRVFRVSTRPLQRLRLSLFEKVILANSLMLIGEALVGLWVTSHNLEAHHYLIDTSFIVAATLFTLAINVILLRASFRPLFNLLWTIRAISAGKTQARPQAKHGKRGGLARGRQAIWSAGACSRFGTLTSCKDS